MSLYILGWILLVGQFKTKSPEHLATIEVDVCVIPKIKLIN